jgi:hypothetical protein
MGCVGRVHFSLGALLFFDRADYESALESPASEPDSQSGGFYNACPNFETHPLLKVSLTRLYLELYSESECSSKPLSPKEQRGVRLRQQEIMRQLFLPH